MGKNKQPKILYISTVCSENVLDLIFNTARNKPKQAAQKFHLLLLRGIARSSPGCITSLSTLPITRHSHSRVFWWIKSEKVEGVKMRYIPIVNLKGLKNFGVMIYTFLFVLLWRLRYIGQPKAVVCDVLFATVASTAQWACRLSGVRCIGIVTDIPGMIVTSVNPNSNRIFLSVYQRIINHALHRFDGYVLLTKQMNALVNPSNRPYMIMEGLVDAKMANTENKLEEKESVKVLSYAGGLYEKYGIKMLIEAFRKVPDKDARLYLYGMGDMEVDMDTYQELDDRLKFLGMVPNKQVVADQLKATLLINPRPTTEEFTKYSFPSKNMEYMVSGTPMVTTNLPGMPPEYLDYVYTFEEETVSGMAKSLEAILKHTPEELHRFGEKARKFVLEYKNNERQGSRVLEFSMNPVSSDNTI